MRYRYLCEGCRHCRGWNYSRNGEVSSVRCEHVPPVLGRVAYLWDGEGDPRERCDKYENANEHRRGVQAFLKDVRCW